MSRIGRMPIAIPTGVDVTIDGRQVHVKGPKGELSLEVSPPIEVQQNDGVITVTRPSDEGEIRALHGLSRSLIANMVKGVTEGYEKRLTLVGVGFRAQAAGDKINLSLGFSHPVVHAMPKGVKVETPQQTEIVVKGIDKQQVGQVAAEIRAYRPPEPYKGKGIRYVGEYVKIKETKKK